MSKENLRVFTGGGQSATVLAEELSESIKDVIFGYSGKMPLATAIGVLEIVKREILDSHNDTS